MKVAIIILSDTETHESLGRVVNALSFAKELKENDDEVLLVFDGAGPRWIPELEDETHKAHTQYLDRHHRTPFQKQRKYAQYVPKFFFHSFQDFRHFMYDLFILYHFSSPC